MKIRRYYKMNLVFLHKNGCASAIQSKLYCIRLARFCHKKHSSSLPPRWGGSGWSFYFSAKTAVGANGSKVVQAFLCLPKPI